MTPASLSGTASSQRGYALMLLLGVLTLAAVIFILGTVSSAEAESERAKLTSAALMQAKEALIGYAITYRNNAHPDDVFGYLPLPDLGTSRNNNPPSNNDEGRAAANFAGNQKNLSAIGRLPWRTLNLPPLRDGYGECLWYVVSGSYQNVQKTDALNWDTIGHFDVFTSNGTPAGTTSLVGTDHHGRPAAIVFSAGPSLLGQNRQNSATDVVSECGGNYDVRNYLDTFDALPTLNGIVNYLEGSTNNATGFASDPANPKKLISTPVRDDAGQNLVNDVAVTITPRNIFGTVKQRSDFATQVKDLLDDSQFQLHLQAMDVAGSKGTDNLDCDTINDDSNKIFCNNWKEMVLLTELPIQSPITIDGMATLPCTRVIIFAGDRAVGQVRVSAADKASKGNYLEGANLAAFAVPIASATDFTGASAFDRNNPTGDVLRCLP